MLHLYKNKITIDKDNLPKSPAIRQIVDDFKKTDATNLLMFIYLVYNRGEDNPLREFEFLERIRRAKKLSFGDHEISIENKFPDNVNLIGTAIREYVKEKVDKVQKEIDLYDKKMYEFIALLKKTKPKIVKNTHTISEKVTFSTNIDILTSILDNSINIILDKALLVTMKKTGKFSNELRGGLSPHEQGKTKIND